MHWKVKAHLQNAISVLPSSFSYNLYYWVQRNFGRLKKMDAVTGLTDGRELWKRLEQTGCDPEEKVFFEIGTGRVPLLPLAYWLMGAKSTITLDLNPYLKPELVRECLHDIARRNADIRILLGPSLKEERLDALLELDRDRDFDIRAFFDLCQIRYIAPGDAARTGLEAASVDIHTSNVVLQHIPPAALKSIIDEGNRIIGADGVFIHRIDYSDHFWHTDAAISAINFLRYSDAEWEKYAGNRYMYLNRLRHDDFANLYRSAGHRILAEEPKVHQPSLALLMSGGLSVDIRFRNKSNEVLATTESWFVTKKTGP